MKPLFVATEVTLILGHKFLDLRRFIVHYAIDFTVGSSTSIFEVRSVLLYLKVVF